MLAKRTSFNPKRRIASAPVQADLDRLADKVHYGGNPEHKRNPGDFGLTPPASPRRNKTLCDGVGVFSRALALELLRDGIRCGLVSEWDGTGFPQNVWSVSTNGIPLEAQLENAANGTYHGYPMPEDDAFREIVISKWGATHE
ncbi:MAG: hypothetical protein WCO56_15730 [Verrucomicrobiota bacterium]